MRYPTRAFQPDTTVVSNDRRRHHQASQNESRRLTDFLELRIPEMDEHGLDMQVLSLTSPGIQAEKDTRVAVTNALKVNDFLKTVIDQHPTHFGGFAALPLQDPKAAADELERTVKQYGFSGGLINAHTGEVPRPPRL
jgi:2,3-dihydroxybenzoate decarboxylase